MQRPFAALVGVAVGTVTVGTLLAVYGARSSRRRGRGRPTEPVVVVWDASVPHRFYGETDRPMAGVPGERPTRWRSVDGSDWLVSGGGPILWAGFGSARLTALRGGGAGMTTAHAGYAANHATYAVVFGPAHGGGEAGSPAAPLLSRHRAAAGEPPAAAAAWWDEAWAGPLGGVFYGWGTGANAPLGPVPAAWRSDPAGTARRVYILSVEGPAVRVRWSGDATDAAREYAVAPDRYDIGRFAVRVLGDPSLALFELQIHRRPLDRRGVDALFNRLTAKWGVAPTTNPTA